MNENQKTLGISAVIALLISLGIGVTPTLVDLSPDVPTYFCESRVELGFQECDSFSKYVHPQGKCIMNDAPNLICRTGWVLIEPDEDLPEEDLPDDISSGGQVGTQFSCNTMGECTRIR